MNLSFSGLQENTNDEAATKKKDGQPMWMQERGICALFKKNSIVYINIFLKSIFLCISIFSVYQYFLKSIFLIDMCT